MRGGFSARLGACRRRGENPPPIRHAGHLKDVISSKNYALPEATFKNPYT